MEVVVFVLYVFYFRGRFVMEYCGDVCTLADFEQRKVEYSKEKRRHYYFMSLKSDQVCTLVQ